MIYPIETRKNYIKIERRSVGFHRNCNEVRNEAIRLFYTLFNDQRADAQWLLRALLDSKSSGIKGELAGISIQGQKVIIRPSSLIEDCYPEDFAIKMNRGELIHLVREWQERIEKKISLIYIYYKDKKYGVVDMLPEGVE